MVIYLFMCIVLCPAARFCENVSKQATSCGVLVSVGRGFCYGDTVDGIPVIRNADDILERNADSTRLNLLQLNQGNDHLCNFRLRSVYDVTSTGAVMDGFMFQFGVDADGSNYDRTGLCESEITLSDRPGTTWYERSR